MKSNTIYEILTPEGFVDFKGVQRLNKKTKEIFFEGGLTLRASYNHIIYDYDNNEIFIKDVKIGDTIKSHNGFLIVESIIEYENETYVYDIIDAGTMHLYYTNDIISHNCNFLGSGDSVIPSEIVENIKENYIQPPVNKFMGGAIWQWKEPIEGHKYILGLDVSRGDSEDFTTFTIVDFDEREQVLEYLGKVPPDVAAEIAFKWATMYSAFVVIDITGGMGVSTSRKLQEMGYKNLYVDGINVLDKWSYNPKLIDKIPGINFNSKRVQIIASFEEALRYNFKVRSSRLMNELNTFVYVNGRPDHLKGQHDDLIMAMAMAIYVGENSFSQLEKVTEQTKAMVNSWTVQETPVKHTSSDFNPGVPVMPNNDNLRRGYSDATKRDYQQHSWLFGRN